MKKENVTTAKIMLNNGKNIPLLGLGTWKAEGKEVEEAVYEAIKQGYRHIDTAKIYGNEREVGNAIRKAMEDFNLKREDLFITSKLWNTDHGGPVGACEDTLSRLDLDYIDLYLIHWPSMQSSNAITWEKMQQLVKDNLCKSVGVSNFNIEQIQELLDYNLPIPQVNQVELSPYLSKKELVDFCQKNHIVVEAYSPLTRGKKLEDPKLEKIAKKYKKTPAQIMLRWAIQHNIVVIPKSTDKDRIKENSEIFDFKIKDADMKTLDGFNENFSALSR